MRKMLIGSIFAFSLFSFAQQAISELPSTFIDVSGVTLPARASTLADSLVGVTPGSTAANSQSYLDAVLGGYNNSGADDVAVPACESWSVNLIEVAGHYFDPLMLGMLGPAESVSVYIFADAAGEPNTVDYASALYVYEGINYSDNGDFDFTIPLPTAALLEGGAAGTTYWVAVRANMALLSGGQWGWTESTVDLGSNVSHWQQSNGTTLDGITGCVNDWQDRSTCNVFGFNNQFAMRLEGEILAKAISVTPTLLNLNEGGAAGTFDVVLDAPPCDTVTIALSEVGSGGTVTDPVGDLVFTTANWAVAQTVTVTPDAADGLTVPLSLTVSSAATSTDLGYDGASGADVTVNFADIDGNYVFTVEPTSGLEVSEDGTMDSFTITAGGALGPVSDVIVDLDYGVSPVVSGPASVTLTGPGYSASVTVTGLDDSPPMVNGSSPFTVTTTTNAGSDGNYTGLDAADVTGSRLDNDVAQVFVSGAPATTEAGGSSVITYTLSASPTSPVTINLSSSDSSEGTVAPSSVVLDSSNWDTGDSVTVTGEDDDIDDGTIAYSVVGEPTSSGETAWSGISVPGAAGSNTDDDTAGFSVDPTDLGDVDEGTTSSFDVELDSEPLFDVSFSVSSSDTSEAMVSTGVNSPGSLLTLTFTPGDWDEPQTVTVTAIDDMARADGDIPVTIFTGNPSSDDPIYGNMDAGDTPDVELVVIDVNPDAAVWISPTSLDLVEDGPSMDFDVVLATVPIGGTVTVTIGQGDATEVSVSESSLTFDAGDWNIPQSVTVTPLLDDIVDADASFDLVNSVSGANYDGATIDNVAITVENVDECEPVTLTLVRGESIEIWGTPGCSLDLYDCSTDPETYVDTFILDALGYADTGVILTNDDCYRVLDALGNSQGSVNTVPTLGQWGMIAMISLLAMAGLFFMRRQRREV